MKSLPLFVALLAFLLLPFSVRAQDAPPPPPDGQGGAPDDDQGASFQTFYDQLGNDGTWIQTDDYGYVFQPNVQDPNWAPYTQGHWVDSDEGWTWVSDEPWGWATYHYGRWANIDGLGWVWVPGSRWAPAWVSWRYGGGYAGWAPLPPDTLEDTDYGDGDYHFGADVDVTFDIGPGCYNFVPIEDIGDPNCGGVIINRSRNYGIIYHTQNITNFNISRNGAGRGGFGGVRAGGPNVATVNAHARNRVPTVQLNAAAGPGNAAVSGNSLSIYAPRVNAATRQQGRPSAVSRTVSHPTFNRGTSISQPLQVNSNVKAPAATAAQIKQAKQAQTHAPSTAKVAGPKNHAPAAGGASNVHPEAANTGEPAHSANTPSTFHPEAANTGEPTHNANPSSSSLHSESANTGEPTVHHTTQPATTPRPESENTGEPAQPERQPTPTVHHEEETPQHTESAPPVRHEEEAPQHTESAPPVRHEESAPASHPSAPPAPQHTASKPPAPANHPAPSGGGGKPQGTDKDPNQKP